MSAFTTPLKYKRLNRSWYEIESEFRFYWNDDLTGEYVQVPKGRSTNFGSIPKFARKLTGWQPTDADMIKAYLIHDELVSDKGSKLIYSDHAKPRAVSWDEATIWLSKSAKVSGAPRLKRYTIAAAVTLHGLFRNK